MRMIFRGERNLAGLRGALAAAIVFLVQNADTDSASRNHLAKLVGVVLGLALECDKQTLALEADPPMQVSGVIAQFDGVADRAWLKAHPSLGRGAHDDRTFTVDQQNRPVKQLL